MIVDTIEPTFYCFYLFLSGGADKRPINSRCNKNYLRLKIKQVNSLVNNFIYTFEFWKKNIIKKLFYLAIVFN